MSSAIDVSTQAVTIKTHDGTQHLVRPTKIKINFGFEPDYDVYLKVAIEKIGNPIDDSGLSDFKLNIFKILLWPCHFISKVGITLSGAKIMSAIIFTKLLKNDLFQNSLTFYKFP